MNVVAVHHNNYCFGDQSHRGYSTKFYTGRLDCPEVQTLTLLYTIFDRKGNPLFHIPSIENGTPFTYLW